ncbi:MAG: LytTR family DNA-binding domain-containing protein [Eubacteriales bacterium]|nr:LytTR family DNA-binding domain-containing protein [Eubacteriales bacterium]
MLRIAVCDDEQSHLHDVKCMLDEYGATHGIELVVSIFSLPFDLAECMEAGVEFGLYLLDVYMPGMTGITLAQQLRRSGINTPIIFLTTSKEHALEAFGVGAVGYLLKPFERKDFFKTLDSIIDRCEPERRRSILLKVNNEMRRVAVREILYCEANKNIQQITLANGEVLQVRMTVSELFAILSPSKNFIRCGAAYILNLTKIRRLKPKSALLTNDTEIPIPRGAYAELKTAYYDFFCER